MPRVIKFVQKEEASTCLQDDDCTGEGEYCAQGTCREAGTCGGSVLDCKNPANVFPIIECVGYMECNADGSCGIECSGSFCPNNDQVECFARPCDVTTCEEPYVSCVDDYCGGCNTIFFNATGHQVCAEEEASTCLQDDDCTGEGEYCAQGTCREAGTCGDSVLDCKNPANVFPIIECVGYMECNADGSCGIECSGSFCPNNDQVECFARPCDVTTCEEPYVSCVDDFCGGCNTIFFNATGHQVCAIASPSLTDGNTSCQSDSDCSAEQACVDGNCQATNTGESDPTSNGSLVMQPMLKSLVLVMALSWMYC